MDHPSGRSIGPVSVATLSIAAGSIIVFAGAVALRLPSCYESLWVDELHSAWCVWGGLSDVAPRADIGHQSPFYFLGLWFWKQIFGGSELALRISSVLAVAASCSVLTLGVARWSGSLIAGMTAGAILAIETNSIFFGTELRPFAWVILFSSIAIVCFARLALLSSRHLDRRSWVGMVVAILFAAICQPTSLGVLILLPATLCSLWLWRDRRQLFRFTLSDGLLILSTAAVGFALWSMTLHESWGERQTWSSFASATSIWQLWRIWDWTLLWCVPIALLIPTIRIGRLDGVTRLSTATLLLASIALIASFGYWMVSWNQWLPLWHRRYFIAVLPMLAFVAGGSVATTANCAKTSKLAPLVAICLVFGLIYRQNMHRSLPHYPVALATRGEDWRGAIDWVRKKAMSNDQIYLESGLIESRQWLDGVHRGIDGRVLQRPGTREQLRYLCYPTSGPYSLDQSVDPIGEDLDIPLRVLNDNTRQIFLIVRRPASRISIGPTKWGWVYGNRTPKEIKSFGNVSVIWLPDGQ